MMKAFLTAGATVVAAIAFSALLAPDAHAGDVCRRDVTAKMVSCGFQTMAQCQATRYGLGGDCFLDPWKFPAGGGAMAMAFDPGSEAMASADYAVGDAYAAAAPAAYRPGFVHRRHPGHPRPMAFYRRPAQRHRGRAVAVRVPRHGNALAYYRPRSERIHARRRGRPIG